MNLFQRIRSWLDYPPRVDQNGDAVRTTAPEIEVGILLTIACLGLAVFASAQINVTHLGTYATGSYNTAAAEIVSFDPVSDRIFFVNAQLNQVVALNASNPASLTLAFTIDMATYGAVANSLCVVPGGIAVAAEASPKTDPGKVVFFDANGNLLSQVTVGAQPDHVSVTPNGQKVLVANEGEPNDTYTIDPEGTISVIDISGGIAGVTGANVTSIDFTAYTPMMLPGVRIFGPGASVAQDMEPEYITVSDDSQKAFVACQENNAVVRIDLATNTIEQVTALGMKDHSLPGNGLDASDSPTGINIANWPVKGLYMPDAIDAFTIGGQTYVAYANEGDAREWGTFVEPRRIGNAAYVLDPVVFPNAATLKQNANLGRLNATIYSGDTDGDTDFDEIHVFGSRSFTIRDANGTIVWDSGDQLEQITSAAYPTNFNSNNSANNSFDTRSDDKGPEPEAVVVANVYGSTYAFIGLERIGGIMVYDVSVPTAPVFVQYINNRNFGGDAAAGTALDLGPEDIKFVSATNSPDGMPFLIVGNEISGTVSTFRINAPPTPENIAVWTYEPLQGAAATPTPNIGSGSSAIVGSMSSASTATGSSTGCAQTTGTTAWAIGTANPGTTNESSGVEYRTSTVGYENITFSYDHRISNTGTRTARIQYTLDGTNWINLDLNSGNYDNTACASRGALDNGRIDAGDPVGTNVSDSWGRRTIDFSGIAAANDNPDFGVRVLAAHYAATAQFRQANNVNNVATAGTWRFDNVTFAGIAAQVNTATINAPVPTSLTGFSTDEGTASAAQTFTIAASDLTADLVITAPAGFELRAQGVGSYASSLNLTGPAVNATIEVRLIGTTAGTYTGNITIASTGATGQTVGVDGQVIAPPVPGVLAVWTFEPLQGAATAPTPNIGSGSSAIVGSMSGAGTSTGTTAGCVQVSGTTAWAIGTASPGTTNESSGVEFRTSTVGHENIVFSYDHRLSNSATRTARIQYTLDGTSWINLDVNATNYDNSACTNRGGIDGGRIDASDPVGTNVSDSWGRRVIDLSGISGANNNPNFGIRILAAHYSNTGQFRTANNLGTVATGGTWRFDNVSFTADVITTPPPFTLQILHASDFEGAVPATEDAPRFAAIVDSLEHTFSNSLTLSSGDNFLPGPFMSAGEDPSLVTPLRNAYINYYGGTPFANNDLRAGIGRVDITILNILGVQASVLGNHEFDLGTSELRNIIGGQNSGANIRWFGAQFPYLSSNLNFSGDANLSSLFTNTREEYTFFQSNPTQTAAAIAATRKLAPSTIITVNGERIGVVGVTTQILASISSPGATTIIGPSSNDMPALAAIVQPVIDDLRNIENIDKIILLSHLQQLNLEKELALLLNGVDVIIAGGSHTLMADATDRLRTGDVAAETYPFLTTGLDGKPIAIVNTTSEYKYVGRLVVDFDANGDIVPSSIDPAISGAYPADSLGVVEVWGDYADAFTPGSKGQEVANLCGAVEAVIIAKDGNLFGRTDVFLEGRRNFVRTEETNLGNVSADANKWMARRYDPAVTISIKNGGGIRSAIGVVNAVGSNVSLDPPAANPIAGKQEGDISQLDIENSLRFNNLLSTLTLTAANLRTILEHGVAASGPGQTQGRFPQVSGVRFSYDETLPANARIRNAVITDSSNITVDTLVMNGMLHGDPSRTFRVVTLNFLAGGGDGYPFNTLGTGRVDLNTLPDAGPGVATFAAAGSEQDAFAEFMKSFHTSSAYALAETPDSLDTRIEEINDREDDILGQPIVAITGCSSSQSPYLKPVGAGNTTTSILTVGDLIGNYDMVGIPDGMGAYDNNDGTFTLLVNHELGATVGITRAHGFAGSFVSKWIINKSDLCVQSGSDLITTLLTWNGSAFVPATAPIGRLCSGDLPPVSAFYNAGTGKGTQELIYMNGEEVGAEGRAFAHIATGPNTGTTYELPYLGKFSWENSLANPATGDKTVVVGTDDTTPGQVYVYIGSKQSTGNEIEKAGLQNGKLYGIKVSGLALETAANFPGVSTAFSLFDLGFVQNTTGAALQSTSVANGVTEFLRPEDAHWDPSNPNTLYFVTTASFTGPSRLYKVTFTDILQPELGGTIVALLNGTEGQKMMDNMTVDQRGGIYIQEDPGNQAHIAKLWKYDIATDVLTQVGYADSARFVTGAPLFLTQDEEHSGIIDMQDILGKGRYLFNVQAHYAIPGELVEGGQILEFSTGDTLQPCVPAGIASITPTTISCSADPLELNVVGTGTLPLSYSWSGNGTFLFGSENASALVDDGQTGGYTVTVSNACGSVQQTVNVTVNVVGTACNDGDPNTVLDVLDENCACAGAVCTQDLVIEFNTDANGTETSWEIRQQGSGILVQSGGGAYPNSAVVNDFTCLPDGCYTLRVLDAAGDGMTNGGYILRTVNGKRIIDNRNNFSTGSVSAISGGEGFCLPIGTDQPINSSCDKLDWVNNRFVVAAANPVVSAQFGVTNTTSGYEFWFFDPNGTYSYRRFRSHATSDGFGTGATRACHFKVNGWINNVLNPHLPANMLLNVRIRGRVAGTNLAYGPACRFKIDPALAACPRTNLQDNPTNTSDFSCGVTRTFGGGSSASNRIVANPPQPVPAVASNLVRYQFRFRLPGEGICIIRPPQTSATLTMNWTSGQPLECGKTYQVDVRVSLNGGATWCFDSASPSCAEPVTPWGKVCNVTISTSTFCPALQSGSSNLTTQANPTLTMYPNPNRGDQLFVSMTDIDNTISTVTMDVYDMTGKRIVARTITAQDGFVNQAVELNSELAAGLYLVNFTAGEQVFSERLVVQP